MKCPICGVELHIAERHGIEIDYYPKCRGIWLDRGELDKIIERAESDRYGDKRYRYDDDDDKDEYKDRDGDDYYHYRKKRSFWGEIFDF
ncbi:MAG: zf-TFIIB domain-containing protein [Candidatus Nitrosocaldus sp.]